MRDDYLSCSANSLNSSDGPLRLRLLMTQVSLFLVSVGLEPQCAGFDDRPPQKAIKFCFSDLDRPFERRYVRNQPLDTGGKYGNMQREIKADFISKLMG